MNEFGVCVLILCAVCFLICLIYDVCKEYFLRALIDAFSIILVFCFSVQEFKIREKDRKDNSVICTEQPSDSISVKKGGEV